MFPINIMQMISFFKAASFCSLSAAVFTFNRSKQFSDISVIFSSNGKDFQHDSPGNPSVSLDLKALTFTNMADLIVVMYE